MSCEYIHVSAHSGLFEHRVLTPRLKDVWIMHIHHGSNDMLLYYIQAQKKKKMGSKYNTLSILNTWGCEEGTAVIEWPRRKAKNINSGFKYWFVSAANRPHAHHTNKQPSVSLSSFKYIVHEISFHRLKELSKRYKQRVGHNKTSQYLTDKWHHVNW